MALTLCDVFKTPSQMIERAFVKQMTLMLQGPLKPKQSLPSLQALQSASTPLLPTHELTKGPLTTAPSQIHCPMPLRTLPAEAFFDSQDLPPFDLTNPLTDPNPTYNTRDNHSVIYPATQSNLPASKNLSIIANMHINLTFTNPAETISAPPSQKQKEKRLPIRRSPRLQARHQVGLPQLKNSTKNKNATTKVPSDMDASLTSLDAGKALQILQATVYKSTSRLNS